MNLGEKIINLRKKERMTQEELAGKLGVSRQTISKWELAQSTPELNYIIKLSELFVVTTDYLLKGEENKEANNVEMSLPNHETQKGGLTARQIAGIIIGTLGGVLTLISIIKLSDNGDCFFCIIVGIITAIIGFELLLLKKNVILKILWTIWCVIAVPTSFILAFNEVNPFEMETVGGTWARVLLVLLMILIIISIMIKIRSVVKIKRNIKKV